MILRVLICIIIVFCRHLNLANKIIKHIRLLNLYKNRYLYVFVIENNNVIRTIISF